MNPLVPEIATIKDIIPETGDVKTFVVEPDNTGSFAYRPGQCAMVSVFGVGEAMISITSTAARRGPLEFSVKRVGRVSGALHEAEPGHKVGVRGPYGNWFPLEDWAGRNLLFVGGGIGLAPLRALINHCLDERDRYGRVDIVYGARSPQDLCFKREIMENWPRVKDVGVHLTVDAANGDWQGAVALVPHFLERLGPSPEGTVAVTCGPPIMIKYTLASLTKLGFADDQIVTTLELKMQCGVGKCGRCNIGAKYVCLDGPVFTYEQLKQLPQEY
ncbi:MAG: FAD/NAD(P)-binding protein [bacterium]|nr:FAD/NAD(P)-binding protein [bacterium]